MTVTRSILLFMLAAIFEIGGAWLIWQGIREHRG
jgi:small multidrug resistance family-3 protein